MHPSPRTCAPTWQLVWFGRFMLQVESVRPLSWVGGYWATGGLSVFLPPVLGSRGSTTLFYLFFIVRDHLPGSIFLFHGANVGVAVSWHLNSQLGYAPRSGTGHPRYSLVHRIHSRKIHRQPPIRGYRLQAMGTLAVHSLYKAQSRALNHMHRAFEVHSIAFRVRYMSSSPILLAR